MFEAIIGNEKIKRELKTIIHQDKISHSYLFIGIEGIGKKMMAKEFAQMILCNKENKPCEQCDSCVRYISNNHPDFEILEPDGNSLKIEQIRSLQKRILEKPIISKYKVYIINDADKMTDEAQNCFLKTLEEPPSYIIIILIGKNESDFLQTIQSRCTILNFEKIQEEQIEEFLKKQYQITSLTSNQKRMFEGSIGKAIRLKEKFEQYETVETIINEMESKDLISILKKAEIIYKSKEEIFEILDYMNVILLNKSLNNPKYTACIHKVEETKKRLKANCNYDMCIDDMLFSIWEEVN